MTTGLMFNASLFAAPGDVLFGDDFEAGSLSANWMIDNNGGGDAGVSNATANSGSQSMFTRWNVVSVTSNAINTAVPAATLSVWVRRGADAFSEEPEANDEDLILEYMDDNGAWIQLQNYPGGGTPGEVFTNTYSLPSAALHANFRIRLRQTGGDGGAPANGGIGWDYWHIDDVIVTEISPPVAGAGFCDDFESGLINWTVTDATRAGISTQTSSSPTHSLFTRHGPVSVTSQLVDMSSVTSGLVTAWIRRGADSFSEDPDNGEDLAVEYLTNTGTWVALETFNGAGNAGQTFSRSYTVPANGLHSNFQLRFRQTGGSGNDYDYWHIDDVCITPGGTPPSSLLAYYAMDEASWNGAANEVQDSSSNNNNGASVGVNGTAPTTDSGSPAITGNPGTCGYGEFPGNSDVNIRQAVDTGVDMNTVGDSGTITFWYKSNQRWNGNRGDRMLLDASTTASGQKYFFFMLRNNSRLRFALEDSNDNDFILDSGNNNFNAGVWVHLAVTWDLPNDRLLIYINGNLDNSNTFGTNGMLGNMGTLYVGDNRSTYLARGASGNSANGSIDEVRIYNSVLTQAQIDADRIATHPCGASFDHIQIEHDGSALTCEPENITVRTCANSDCSSIYSGDVNITFTPTGWLGGDTQTITGGNGILQLQNTSAGIATLGVSSSAPVATNPVVCLNTTTSANDCNLTYFETGFIYNIPTQTACTTSTPITISAVRMDNTSQACVPTFIGQNRNVSFSLNYVNPNTGTRSLTLNYNGTDYAPIDNTNSQTVPLSFDANGQATFNVTYPDAGQISLASLYTGSAGTGDAGLSMSGSASFINKPAKLYVFADETNSDCSGSTPSCSAFKRAGETFNLKVRAACNDNSVTPNFQLNGLSVSHTNTAPAIVQGTLGTSNFDVVAADSGEHTINQTVSEVGAYTFTVNLPATGYFGETIGSPALNTSTEIGRFYPGHFCLSANSIMNRTDPGTATGCTDGFSYLDEQFDTRFTLTAQASNAVCSDGTLTQNYSNDWSKFDLPFNDDTSNASETGKWNFGAVNDPAGTPTNLNARIGIDSGTSSPATFTNGQAVVTAKLNINRAGVAPAYLPETPFTDVRIGINPVDTDNVTLDSTDLTIGADNYREAGNTILYFGRLFAENAFGTNQNDVGLDMYARTEYCNAVNAGECSDWQHATLDSCTLYNINPPADVQLGSDAANIGTPGYYLRASPTVTSSVFNFSDDGSASSYARIHVPDNNNHSGGWRLFYTAGGDGGNYTIPFRFPLNTDPAVHPYLLHVDGVASFGQFRGDDRIIFWREILE
ncbi:MAG: sialidase domain-containing protein [Thioalkalispiraceae bacterium]|jgi:MSHA biogenesis protein MshQ